MADRIHTALSRLQQFESEYPNHRSLSLTEACNRIEQLLGHSIPLSAVKQFLTEKGYTILEYNISEVSDSRRENSRNTVEVTNIQNFTSEDGDSYDFDADIDSILQRSLSIRSNSELNKPKKSTTSPWMKNRPLLAYYQQTKDPTALQDIVQSNVNLVKNIASRYANHLGHTIPFEDLVSEGIVGLLKAVDRFDTGLETQFSTYATWWIRQSITRAIFDKGNMVRVPVHMGELILKITNIEQHQLACTGQVEKQEICEQLGITIEKYHEAKRVNHQFFSKVSLNKSVSDDEESELINLISTNSHLFDPNAFQEYDPENIYLKKDRNLRLYQIINGLSDRQHEVISKRFGFDNTEHTLEEVGVHLSITRERVRQIEAKSLGLMRKRMKSVKNRDEWLI